MFIVHPTNVDYLIDDVRLRIGDIEGTRFSDSIIRSCIIGGVKMLQRRWKNRYLIFTDEMVIQPPAGYIYQTDYENIVANSGDVSSYTNIIPRGYLYGSVPQGYAYIPSGLKPNDVLRNPYHSFTDPGPSVVSQEDETPIIIASCMSLRVSQMSSSSDTFQSWSDGEFSFSNIASSRAMIGLYASDLAELNSYFPKKLSSAIKGEFPFLVYPITG